MFFGTLEREFKMKIAFIVNSLIKKKASVIEEIHAVFKNDTYVEYHILETNGPGDAILLAHQSGTTHQILIAVGGDGTLNEVINGVMRSNNSDKVIIGQLPCGTANDFAKSANSTPMVEDLYQLIKAQKIKRIDLAHSSFYSEGSSPFTRYFINIADVGIAAEIVEKVNHGSKMLGPSMSYMKAIIGSLISYSNEEVSITADDYKWSGKVKDVVIANGKFFGGGLGISPDSILNDGLLNLVILGDFSMFDFFKHISAIQKSKKISHEKLIYKTAKNITVEGVNTNLLVEMDGEFVGYTKASFSVLKEQIQFLMK